MTNQDMTNKHDQQESPSFLTGRAAIYTRGGKQQTQQPQYSDLLFFAQEQGFTAERITVFEEGYVSGAATKREALNALIAAITEPEEGQERIRAVFVSSEDRLFRDSPLVDVAAFIEQCRANGVLLITPAGVYDFTDAAQVALFHFKIEQAYQFVTQMVTSRLQAGKRAAAARRKAGN